VGLGTLFCFCTPLLRVGRFPVFLLRLCAVFGGLLCFLVLFLACSCPSGFFLLSVGVVVLSVLSGAVGSCLFGVALLLRLRFRWLMLGLCVVSSGASFLPALPLLPSGGWGLFFRLSWWPAGFPSSRCPPGLPSGFPLWALCPLTPIS